MPASRTSPCASPTRNCSCRFRRGTETGDERTLTVNAVVCGLWIADDAPSSTFPRTAAARGLPNSPHGPRSGAPYRQLPTLLPHPERPPPGCRDHLGPAIRLEEERSNRPAAYPAAKARGNRRSILEVRRTWISALGEVRSTLAWIGGARGRRGLRVERPHIAHESRRHWREHSYPKRSSRDLVEHVFICQITPRFREGHHSLP